MSKKSYEINKDVLFLSDFTESEIRKLIDKGDSLKVFDGHDVKKEIGKVSKINHINGKRVEIEIEIEKKNKIFI